MRHLLGRQIHASSLLQWLCVFRYPVGYTIMYIPYYSPVYVPDYGHWAVYNEQGVFYDFDDSETSPDFYDYESELPGGCEYSSPGQDILGSPDAPLDLVGLPNLGGVPAPAPAPAAVAAAAAPSALEAAPPPASIPAMQPSPGSGAAGTVRAASVQGAAETAAGLNTVGMNATQAAAPAVAAAGLSFGPVLAPASAPGAGNGTALSIVCKPIATRSQQA